MRSLTIAVAHFDAICGMGHAVDGIIGRDACIARARRQSRYGFFSGWTARHEQLARPSTLVIAHCRPSLSKHAICMGGLVRIADFLQRVPTLYARRPHSSRVQKRVGRVTQML